MYAEMKGWTVAEVYHLEGVSGKSVLKHPETQRMMAEVEKGHITGLIFSKLERLGRNAQELLYFADFFQERGADLISLAEAIDTSTRTAGSSTPTSPPWPNSAGKRPLTALRHPFPSGPSLASHSGEPHPLGTNGRTGNSFRTLKSLLSGSSCTNSS